MAWTPQDEDEFLRAMGEAGVAPPAEPPQPGQPAPEPAPEPAQQPVEPIGPERTVGQAPGLGEPAEPAEGLEWPPPEWLGGAEPEQPAADELEREARPALGEEPGLETPQLEPPPTALEPTQVPEDDFDREVARQFGMSPAEHGVDRARREAEREQFIRDRRMQQIEESRQLEKEAREQYQQRVQRADQRYQELERRSQEVAEQDIDPDRWWSDQSAAQSIANVISAGLSGLMAPRRGGRNPTLERINQEIERDIQSQVANLDHERAAIGQQQGIVAQMYQSAQDQYQAAQMARATSFDLAAQEIEAMGQSYDQRGYNAAWARNMAGEERAKAAQARQEARDAELQREMDIWEHQREERELRMKEQEQARARVPTGGSPAEEPGRLPAGKLDTDPETGQAMVGGRAVEEVPHDRLFTDPRTGQEYVARTSDLASHADTKASEYATAKDALDELHQLIVDSDAKYLESEGRAIGDQEKAEVNAARDRAAVAIATLQRETSDPSKNYIETVKGRLPGVDIVGQGVDSATLLDGEIASQNRRIRRVFRRAGITRGLGDIGEQGAPAPRGPNAEGAGLSDRDHMAAREAIEGADLSTDRGRKLLRQGEIASQVSGLSKAPVEADDNRKMTEVWRSGRTLQDTIQQVRSERERAREQGDEELARAASQTERAIEESLSSLRQEHNRLAEHGIERPPQYHGEPDPFIVPSGETLEDVEREFWQGGGQDPGLVERMGGQ